MADAWCQAIDKLKSKKEGEEQEPAPKMEKLAKTMNLAESRGKSLFASLDRTTAVPKTTTCANVVTPWLHCVRASGKFSQAESRKGMSGAALRQMTDTYKPTPVPSCLLFALQ